MISFKTDRGIIGLPAGSSISFEVIHPAFSDELQGGGYSWPVDIDNNPENNFILGFPSSLHRFESSYRIDADLYFKDHFYKRGVLIIDRPGTEKHSGYFRTGIQSWAVLDKKLSEVDYGNDFIMGADSDAVIATAKNIAKTDYQWYKNGFFFPMVYNPDFYGSTNTQFLGFLNRYDRTNDKYFKNVLVSSLPQNTDCLVPMPYFAYILRKIAEEEGYRLPDTAFDGAEFSGKGIQNMFFYSNYALDKLAAPMFKVIVGQTSNNIYTTGMTGVSDLILDNETGYFSDPDGVFDTSTFKYRVQLPGPHKIHLKFDFTARGNGHAIPYSAQIFADVKISPNVSIAIPSPFQVHMVDGGHYTLETTLNPSFTMSDVGKDIWVKIVMNYFHTLNDVECTNVVFDVQALQNSALNLYSNQFNYRDIVPDMTVRDFLTEWRRLRAIDFILKEDVRELQVITRDRMFSPTDGPEDITRKALPEHAALANEDRVRMIGYEWPSDDELVQGNFALYDKSLFAGSVPGLQDLSTFTPSQPGQTLMVDDLNALFISVLVSGSLVVNRYRDDYDDYFYDAQGNVDLKCLLCPLFMVSMDDGFDANTVIPQIKQKGRSTPFATDGSLPSPRWAYWGTDPAGWPLSPAWYPFATTQPTIYANALDNCGSKFIYNSFSSNLMYLLLEHLKTFNLRKTNYLWEKDIDFILADIQNLSDTSRGIYFLRMIDQVPIVIRQVSISLGDGIDLSKIQFLRNEP